MSPLRAAESPFEAAINLDPIERADRDADRIQIKDKSPLSDIDENLENFNQLLDIFDQFKKVDLNYTKSLLAKIKNQETLSGLELFVLRKTITVYYRINRKILDFAKVYDFGGFTMTHSISNEDSNIRLVKAHLIWLTGHLLVLDHLEEMHHILYESDGLFRRIVKSALIDKVNDQEDGQSKTLNDILKMNKYAVDIGESIKFSQQINLVRSISEDLKQMVKENGDAISLINIMLTNNTAKEISRGKKDFGLKHFTVIDTIISVANKITGWLSKVFGNLAGSINWRKGFFYKNEEISLKMRTLLRPMDILIEKSPFTLTDKFIPGHFGHVAIYLGTKEQLESIGMWDHPQIIKYQEEISRGHVILEAVRSGVKLSSLEEFLNIDEISIIRKKDILEDSSVLIEQITRGIDQIGKAYDFNFDISTLDKIVCSELVYIMYGNTIWPTHYRLGRPTITPDDVAEIMFYKNTKYQLIDYLVSKEQNIIKKVGLENIAYDLDYELRRVSGEPIENDTVGDTSYWKKQTKCYRVVDNQSNNGPDSESNSNGHRSCNVTYKEFMYEERNTI